MLLLVANWYLPGAPPMASFGEPVDSAMIHVRSQHKWPQRLQFDTSAPSMLAPSPPVVAATAPMDPEPAPNPKLNAMAEAKSSEKPAAAKPKPRVAMRHRYRPPPLQPRQFAVNPWPSAWAQNW